MKDTVKKRAGTRDFAKNVLKGEVRGKERKKQSAASV